jgi:hypothetical protein
MNGFGLFQECLDFPLVLRNFGFNEMKVPSSQVEIPHDVQVRRISWVVGSVDWQANLNGSSCRYCKPVDPQSSAAV